jgi:hypothetical protein
MYVPNIVTKYVPGVPVLKVATTLQVVPIPTPQDVGAKDGAEKPDVTTAVKLIKSVLATGQPFRAVAVIVTPLVLPLGPITSVAFDVAARYGLLAGSPISPVRHGAGFAILPHVELGM